MNRKTKFSLVGAAVALITTVALAAGFDQINSGYLKIGNGAASTKTLEFNVGNTTNDPIITGDSTNNLNVSAAATRFLERPANGTNYVELNVPAAMSGNVAFTLPTAAAASNGAVLTATTAGVMSFVSPLPLANGGTNATSKSGAFDSLSPMTTAGDVIYGGTSGTGTRLGAGSATTLLHSGTTPSWSAVSMTADVTGTLPAGNGGTGITSLGSGIATWLGTPSSANLRAALTDESGTGAAIFGSSPNITSATLTTPVIDVTGASFAGSSTGNTILKAAATASGTLTLPAATDTLVGKATADVFTNKTLSGNTATNLISGSGTLTLNTSGTATVPNQTTTLAGTNFDNAFTNKQTITGAASQEALIVNGVTGQYAAHISNGAAAGSSFGILSQAGGNSSDYTLVIENRTGTDRLTIRGDGVITLAGPTIQLTGAVSITGTGGNVAHGTNIQQTTCNGSGTGVCTATCTGTDTLTGGGCTTSSGSFIKSFPNTTQQWRCEQATTGSNIVAYGICASY